MIAVRCEITVRYLDIEGERWIAPLGTPDPVPTVEGGALIGRRRSNGENADCDRRRAHECALPLERRWRRTTRVLTGRRGERFADVLGI